MWWAPAVPIERAKRAALEQSLLVDTRAPLGVDLNWKGSHADRLDRVYMVCFVPSPLFKDPPFKLQLQLQFVCICHFVLCASRWVYCRMACCTTGVRCAASTSLHRSSSASASTTMCAPSAAASSHRHSAQYTAARAFSFSPPTT